MSFRSPLSIISGVVKGAAVGWMGASGNFPPRTPWFLQVPSRRHRLHAVQTTGGRHVTLMPAANRAAATEIAAAQASSGGKPNILVMFGDDVGQSNISAYTHGLVGYQTTNIDRIAHDGTMLTDYYAENRIEKGLDIDAVRGDMLD